MSRTQIDNHKVYNVWGCTNRLENRHNLDEEDIMCLKDSHEIVIHPAWHEDNGTPMCDCDEDMVYVRTEIDIDEQLREEYDKGFNDGAVNEKIT
jgi:hypothetical protein